MDVFSVLISHEYTNNFFFSPGTLTFCLYVLGPLIDNVAFFTQFFLCMHTVYAKCIPVSFSILFYSRDIYRVVLTQSYVCTSIHRSRFFASSPYK